MTVTKLVSRTAQPNRLSIAVVALCLLTVFGSGPPSLSLSNNSHGDAGSLGFATDFSPVRHAAIKAPDPISASVAQCKNRLQSCQQHSASIQVEQGNPAALAFESLLAGTIRPAFLVEGFSTATRSPPQSHHLLPTV